MLWYGDDEHKRLFEAMKEDGFTHPALQRKPELRRDCIRYFDAYRHLGSARIWSQAGPLPIQTSEVMSLLKDGLGLEDPETRMKYLRLIRRMDRVELKYLHAQTAKATAAATAKPPPATSK